MKKIHADQEDTDIRIKRSQITQDLKDGKLEEEWVTIEVTEQITISF